MKTVLVTGGTRGIGYGILEKMVADGCFVYFTFRSSKQIAEEIETRFGPDRVKGFQVEHFSYEAIEEIVTHIHNDRGPIDILVNNLGITRDNLFAMMPFDDFSGTIENNLIQPAAYIRTVVRDMISKKNGVIINISSVSALIGPEGQSNYAASKAGMISMTKSLARELGKYSIRVVGIAPGYIETDMYAKIPMTKKRKMIDSVPLRRPGTVAEIANVTAFLASDGASYITGTTIVADGGLS